MDDDTVMVMVEKLVGDVGAPCDQRVHVSFKAKTYRTVVRPVVQHAIGTVLLKKTYAARTEVAEVRMLRCIPKGPSLKRIRKRTVKCQTDHRKYKS